MEPLKENLGPCSQVTELKLYRYRSINFVAITLNGHSTVFQERAVGNGVIHMVNAVLMPGDGIYIMPILNQLDYQKSLTNLKSIFSFDVDFSVHNNTTVPTFSIICADQSAVLAVKDLFTKTKTILRTRQPV